MSEGVSRQTVVALCELAVLDVELRLGLCPDQSIAFEMVDVVAKTLKSRISSQWASVHTEARLKATANAAGLVRHVLKRIKETR